MLDLLFTGDALPDRSVLGRRVGHCAWCQHMRGIWGDGFGHTSTRMVVADVPAQLLPVRRRCRCEGYARYMHPYSRLVRENLAAHLATVHIDIASVVGQRMFCTCAAWVPYIKVLNEDKTLGALGAAAYVQHTRVECTSSTHWHSLQQ